MPFIVHAFLRSSNTFLNCVTSFLGYPVSSNSNHVSNSNFGFVLTPRCYLGRGRKSIDITLQVNSLRQVEGDKASVSLDVGE